jgi:hypothetical protein
MRKSHWFRASRDEAAHVDEAEESQRDVDQSSNSDYASNSSGTASPVSSHAHAELAVEPALLDEGRYYGDFEKVNNLGLVSSTSRQGTEASAIDALTMLAMLGRA